jgi:glycerol-3-phosphate dehydrogenase (NAD(P)+)
VKGAERRSGDPARIAIVGTGAWGTTMSVLLGAREPVTLIARRPDKAAQIEADRRNDENLPGVELPAGVTITTDLGRVRSADLVIFAVPSAHLRDVATHVAPFIAAGADVLSLVKGLERHTLLRPSEVLAAATGIDPRRIAALSGPNLAAEIARGLPASAVVGAEDQELARRIQGRLGTRSFRLYVNADITGVELCGALKNIVAIAAGAADGLGFGDNGKAGLITRGLAEMIRLGLAAGANPLTFAGLAGIGDVVATCASGLSRNHRLGVELARGRRWAEIEATLPGIAEGAYTVEAALALADRLGVEMPIAREVRAALFEGKSVQRCLLDLLARESKDELADLPPWLERIGTSAEAQASSDGPSSAEGAPVR